MISHRKYIRKICINLYYAQIVHTLIGIVKYIQQVMYPVKLRFGIGLGEIKADIFYEDVIDVDGFGV